MKINKLLFTCTIFFLLANNTIAELRNSEKEFLEKLQTKKQSAPLTKRDDQTQDPTPKYEECQVALKKIDKLLIEISKLKTTPEIDEKQWKNRIKSIESQVERYKIQAKQFCSKGLLINPCT